MRDAIWHWPKVSELPPSGRFVLICVRTSGRRAEARKEVRAVLRRILAQWSRLSPDEIPLRETPCGPVGQSELQEHLRATSKCQNSESLDFSLSYTEDEAWIAVRRGGVIGIDIMRLEPVPEAEAIAQTYFSPADRSALQQSTDPVRDFALAWTQLEARCKCLKQGLTEWSEASATHVPGCSAESVVIEDRLALSVATVPQDFRCRRNA
jgi:4'-phosphopantetheinyl transferase